MMRSFEPAPAEKYLDAAPRHTPLWVPGVITRCLRRATARVVQECFADKPSAAVLSTMKLILYVAHKTPLYVEPFWRVIADLIEKLEITVKL